MGKSVSPEHSETQRFSITVPVFLHQELKELIGMYGTSLSDVIVHIAQTWFTANQENVQGRLARYKKFRGARPKRKA